MVDEVKIISLVLYKKYSKVYNWLSYNDLYLIILRIKEKYKNVFKNKNIDSVSIKHFDKKLFALLEKIEEKKCLRNYEETVEEERNGNNNNKLELESLEMKEEEKTFFSETNVPMKEILGFKTYNILVDSFDRNKSAWKEINPFSFPMGYNLSIQNEYEKSDKNADEYGGSVSKTFSNVESIKITKIMIE